MNAADFIHELLLELGEDTLAEKVSKKLEDNDEAHLPLRFADGGEAREINVHYNAITVEME
jgi:hypothetical protein